jgi:hypothetical protein
MDKANFFCIFYYLNPVTGFALIDEVVLADDVDGARQLSSRSFFRQLLDGQRLVVAVRRQAELRLKTENTKGSFKDRLCYRFFVYLAFIYIAVFEHKINVNKKDK